MAKWVIRVLGKERKEVDKHLVMQAVLAFGRQLKRQQAVRDKAGPEARP